jgi:cytochrome o ubiquinol oxidase operon protein cyoD
LTAHHNTHAGHGAGHGSKGSLWAGSILSILLTVIPFWMVMSGAVDATVTTVAIFVMAIAQIVVHVVCLLHVDSRSENGWTLLAFIFTAIIVGITIIGTIWVMYHMNLNMMPMSVDGMSQIQ